MAPPTRIKRSSLVAQCATSIATIVCVALLSIGLFALYASPNAPEDIQTVNDIPGVTTASYPPPAEQTLVIGAELDTYVRQAVFAALRDPVGRPDYALRAEGAKVHTPLTTAPPVVEARSYQAPRPRPKPDIALRDELRNGECWRFGGGSGQLAVRMPYLIRVTIP